MSPPPAAVIPIAPTILYVADALPTPTIPTTFVVPHAIFVLPTATVTNDSRGKPSNSIKVVPTMQMKKKNIKKARKKNYQTRGTQQGSTSQTMEVHVVQQSRRFSNFNQLRSTVLDRLIQKGLLRPLTNSKPPNPNLSSFDPKSYCRFHQVAGHSTDSCMCLKHEIQNLIDSEKITNPEKSNPNQNTKTNHFLNHQYVPPLTAIVTSSRISKEESPDTSKNEERIKKPAALGCSPREIEKEVIEEVNEEI